MKVYFFIRQKIGHESFIEDFPNIEEIVAKMRDEKRKLGVVRVEASYATGDGNRLTLRLQEDKPR